MARCRTGGRCAYSCVHEILAKASSKASILSFVHPSSGADRGPNDPPEPSVPRILVLPSAPCSLHVDGREVDRGRAHHDPLGRPPPRDEAGRHRDHAVRGLHERERCTEGRDHPRDPPSEAVPLEHVVHDPAGRVAPRGHEHVIGGGELLPRGRLREPLDGLARASAFVLSRTEPGLRTAYIESVIRRYNATAPIFRAGVRAVE